jgi:hypothetical protein
MDLYWHLSTRKPKSTKSTCPTFVNTSRFLCTESRTAVDTGATLLQKYYFTSWNLAVKFLFREVFSWAVEISWLRTAAKLPNGMLRSLFPLLIVLFWMKEFDDICSWGSLRSDCGFQDQPLTVQVSFTVRDRTGLSEPLQRQAQLAVLSMSEFKLPDILK